MKGFLSSQTKRLDFQCAFHGNNCFGQLVTFPCASSGRRISEYVAPAPHAGGPLGGNFVTKYKYIQVGTGYVSSWMFYAGGRLKEGKVT